MHNQYSNFRRSWFTFWQQKVVQNSKLILSHFAHYIFGICMWIKTNYCQGYCTIQYLLVTLKTCVTVPGFAHKEIAKSFRYQLTQGFWLTKQIGKPSKVQALQSDFRDIDHFCCFALSYFQTFDRGHHGMAEKTAKDCLLDLLFYGFT